MKIRFTKASQADLDGVAGILSAPAFRTGYAATGSLSEMRTGSLAIAALGAVRQLHAAVTVRPERIEGVACEWLEADAADPGRTLIYLHGGAFVRGSLDLGRANASYIAAVSGMRVVAVGYRQAPEHRYPAAPDDVARVYRALRGSGLAAASIGIVGESSGGCLAFGLAAALAAHADAMPAGIAALSPMVDLDLRGASWQFNAATDIADIETGRKAIALYIDEDRRREPVASPIRSRFGGWCPLFIAIGSHETMLSDAERLAHKADDAGVDVTFAVYERMPHGFTRFDIDIATRALGDAARWCAARTSGHAAGPD